MGLCSIQRQDVEKIQYASVTIFYSTLESDIEGDKIVRTNYTIGIIVFDDVLTSEVIGPAEVFGIAGEYEWFEGSKVLLIGVEQQSVIRTSDHIKLVVDYRIEDDIDLDVLVVPGAMDVEDLLKNEALSAFIQKHEQTSQWVSSICAGAFILGNAGVLDGLKATTWFGGETSLQEQFPEIQVIHDNPVVIDNRHITANGGLVSYRMALILLAQLTSREHAQLVYKRLGIARIGDWDAIEASLSSQALES
jgi:transcriptional regulator GlxA family with amidase domain